MSSSTLSVLLYFSISFLLVSAAADPCNVFKNCRTCLFSSQPCGWCGSTGRCMTADPIAPFDGPLVSRNNSQACPRWEYHTSRVLASYNISSVIKPSVFEVYLRPGVPVNVTVEITIPTIPPIDLLVLQDASYSMLPWIRTVVSLVKDISAGLKNLTSTTDYCKTRDDCVKFGQVMYLEKPQAPFANYPESFIFKSISKITDNLTEFTGGLVQSQDFVSRNYEHPEDPLEALLYMSRNNRGPESSGFRYGGPVSVFHIALVLTDAGAHVAGDGKNLGIFKPNNGDGVLDADPGQPPGSGEDYPSLAQVREALLRADVQPLFAVAPKISGFYKRVVTEFAFGGVAIMEENAGNVVQVIVDGTKEILSKASLALTDDVFERFLTFAHPNPEGSYVNVSGGQTVSFIITLEAPEDLPEYFNKSSDVVFKYVGFGNEVTIHTYMNITCIGCDAGNATSQVDICGVCGGTGNCYGCDGILESEGGAKLDICGVCGGSNETCIACDGIGFVGQGGAELDACGDCDGDNSSCIGCDGIINSGKEFVTCSGNKICDGDPNCDQVTTLIALGVTVAVVGVVAAIIGIILCLGMGAAMVAAEKMMLDKEAQLQLNPLYEEAKKKFDNPLYTPTPNQ